MKQMLRRIICFGMLALFTAFCTAGNLTVRAEEGVQTIQESSRSENQERSEEVDDESLQQSELGDYTVDIRWKFDNDCQRVGVSIKTTGLPANYRVVVVFNMLTNPEYHQFLVGDGEIYVPNDNGHRVVTVYFGNENGSALPGDLSQMYSPQGVCALPFHFTVTAVDCNTVLIDLGGITKQKMIARVKADDSVLYEYIFEGGTFNQTVDVSENREFTVDIVNYENGFELFSETVKTAVCPIEPPVDPEKPEPPVNPEKPDVTELPETGVSTQYFGYVSIGLGAMLLCLDRIRSAREVKHTN